MAQHAPKFNLLLYVQKRRVLSLKWMVIIVALYAAILLLLYLATYIRDAQLRSAIIAQDRLVNQAVLAFHRYVNGQKRVVVAVLPSSMLQLKQQGFYAAFHDLSTLHLDDLWLTRLMIDRQVPVIRFEGIMRSSDTLNAFLDFLSQTPTYRQELFVGLNVQPAQLPAIPKEYQATIAALQLPVFYRFTAQTTALKAEAIS